MRSIHRGRLHSVDDPSIEIPATVSFDRNNVYISTEGQTLGRWPIEDIEAERQSGNRFSLIIGGEEWTLAADDPADFLASSLLAMSNRGLTSRIRHGFYRLREAGITLGSFALAVATTLTAYAGGLMVGRYRLDGSRGFLVASLVLIVALSLIRVGASKRLRPTPSVAVRALDRRPTHVTRLVGDHPRPAITETTRVALPGPLFKEEPQSDRSLTPIGIQGASELVIAAVVTVGGQDDPGQTTDLPDTPTGHTLEGDEEPEPTMANKAPAPEPIERPVDAEDARTQRTKLNLKSIRGIGPAMADRLNHLGIKNIYALAALDDQETIELASHMGRYGERLIQQDWTGQARLQVGPSDPDTELGLTDIRGIGPALAERLAAEGINNIYALAALDDERTTEMASRMGSYGSRLVTQDWGGQARRLLASR